MSTCRIWNILCWQHHVTELAFQEWREAKLFTARPHCTCEMRFPQTKQNPFKQKTKIWNWCSGCSWNINNVLCRYMLQWKSTLGTRRCEGFFLGYRVPGIDKLRDVHLEMTPDSCFSFHPQNIFFSACRYFYSISVKPVLRLVSLYQWSPWLIAFHCISATLSSKASRLCEAKPH